MSLLNEPAERAQTDGKQDYYSELSGLDCSADTDLTRQEYKDDADINKLLARYGVGIPQRRMVFGGEVDYTLDLQQAHEATFAAQRAWQMLPDHLKDEMPTWQAMLSKLATGEAFNFEPPKEEPPPPKPTT